MNKYIYLLVLQANYGYGHGFEDIEEVNRNTNQQLNDKLVSPHTYMRYLSQEHKIACPTATYRIINRREPIIEVK